MKNFSGVLKNWRLFLVPASLSVTAIVLLVISSMVGVDHFIFNGKEVGYLQAPNWTISFILVFPLVGALTILILHKVDQSIRELGERRMLFDTTNKHFLGGQKDLGLIKKKWSEILRIAFWMWIVLAVLGFAASFKEWWDSSYVPLSRFNSIEELVEKVTVDPKISRKQPGDKLEIDWAIAGLEKKDVNKKANYFFSLAAFLLLQGTALSFLSFFLVIGVAFGAFVVSLSGQGRFVALPDPNSRDDRRGFEIFQDLGSLMLLCSLCLFFAFYLTIIQNVYLHISDATSIYQMLAEPVRRGFTNGDVASLFNSKSSADYSSSFARIGGGVVGLLVGLLVPGLLLSYLASRARSRMLEIARSPEGLAILNKRRTTIEEALRDMRIWPYRYFSLNMLIGAALLLVATLFLPHLAGYLYGVALAAVIALVIMRIRDQFKGPGADSESDSSTTLKSA